MKLAKIAALAAIPFSLALTSAQAEELRLSHQFAPGDLRHKIAQMVADDVAAANVDLTIKIFPSGSLFKATEQYLPLSRGQLDMTVLPLSYAGGQHPEYNLTLMPGLIKSHDHAARMNASPFMGEIERILNEDDVLTLVHGYLAGGFASVDGCITKPDDVKGKTVRAAGKGFEEMLQAAGASIASMPSSETYNAMQQNVLQAMNTSSSSFVSFRLQELAKCYTPAGDVALWFMYQPLLVNKTTFDGLKPEQQEALRAAAAKAEAYYLEEAKKEDAASVEVFKAAGVEIAQMSPEDFDAWKALAQESSYKEFVKDVPDGQKLLDMALSVE
ncbi:TRAP transporter substrate-binding protein DctP [Paracoccus sp. MBLB3053]|uniref:TRAP transporter substrate-binding protein DctP n=1 Tax=Paracoccus aurantius TaxID=3073814 RepID=A0ABU2HXF5_9RHOB|nr:TRAP transporter substrate-binding protein DctP [Paracoccus sp. MBLB3053]MDS9468994.1 TRAP transporter substrate-binding protein DctP [Paracoccus sp. MBLB3053]